MEFNPEEHVRSFKTYMYVASYVINGDDVPSKEQVLAWATTRTTAIESERGIKYEWFVNTDYFANDRMSYRVVIVPKSLEMITNHIVPLKKNQYKISDFPSDEGESVAKIVERMDLNSDYTVEDDDEEDEDETLDAGHLDKGSS